jgi:hypothetical protein
VDSNLPLHAVDSIRYKGCAEKLGWGIGGGGVRFSDHQGGHVVSRKPSELYSGRDVINRVRSKSKSCLYAKL